jgi:hypothetical protein
LIIGGVFAAMTAELEVARVIPERPIARTTPLTGFEALLLDAVLNT